MQYAYKYGSIQDLRSTFGQFLETQSLYNCKIKSRNFKFHLSKLIIIGKVERLRLRTVFGSCFIDNSAHWARSGAGQRRWGGTGQQRRPRCGQYRPRPWTPPRSTSCTTSTSASLLGPSYPAWQSTSPQYRNGVFICQTKQNK